MYAYVFLMSLHGAHHYLYVLHANFMHLCTNDKASVGLHSQCRMKLDTAEQISCIDGRLHRGCT